MNASLKGYIGELSFKSKLDILCKNKKNIYYSYDTVIKTLHSSTQIDFIILSPYICACVEYKTWDGNVIIPDYLSDPWCVAYYKSFKQLNNLNYVGIDGGVVTPKNPFSQNEYHRKALNKIPGLTIKFKNIIVFPDSTKLYGNTDCDNVFNESEFLNLLCEGTYIDEIKYILPVFDLNSIIKELENTLHNNGDCLKCIENINKKMIDASNRDDAIIRNVLSYNYNLIQSFKLN